MINWPGTLRRTDQNHFSSKVWHKPAPIPLPQEFGDICCISVHVSIRCQRGLGKPLPKPCPGLADHSQWPAQDQRQLLCSATRSVPAQLGSIPRPKHRKQTLSCDCELDLCLDFPKLILGFTDVDGLVIQRGTWSTGGRSLSLVGLESPEQAPGWGPPSPAPPPSPTGTNPSELEAVTAQLSLHKLKIQINGCTLSSYCQ